MPGVVDIHLYCTKHDIRSSFTISIICLHSHVCICNSLEDCLDPGPGPVF